MGIEQLGKDSLEAPQQTSFKPGVVSVIIPVFNRVEFISETLESALAQRGVESEVIVIDDGSQDGSYELLCQYSESGSIKLLSHAGRENRGQSASINLGLNHAVGEFIAILDSDDLFAEDKLKKQVEFLNSRADCGLVYGLGIAIDADGKHLYDILSPSHVETNDPCNVLVDCYFLLPQNSLVRRSVYDEVGFFEEKFRAAQDHDMLIRMAEVTRFGFLPDLMFYYRRHAGSISNTGSERRWLTGFEILARAAKRYPYPRSIVRKRAAVLNFRMGQVRLKHKRYGSAINYFARSGVLDPMRACRVLLGKEKP